MVDETGIEPATSSLRILRLTCATSNSGSQACAETRAESEAYGFRKLVAESQVLMPSPQFSPVDNRGCVTNSVTKVRTVMAEKRPFLDQ
jgi:hypothetical protein